MLKYTHGDRWTVAEDYSRNGLLIGITRLTRDDKGNELEDIGYDGAGNVKRKIRYEYKFDKFGNWIVEKTFRWNTEGMEGFRLEEVNFRQIEYFGK